MSAREALLLDMKPQKPQTKAVSIQVSSFNLLEITSQISTIFETRKTLESEGMGERVSREKVKKTVREKMGEERWLEGDWARRWKILEAAAELCNKK